MSKRRSKTPIDIEDLGVNQKKEEDVIDISQVDRPFNADYNLRDFEGQEIVIKDITWINTQKYGEVPILTIEYEKNGEIYEAKVITFSRVIINQLRRIGADDLIAQGKKIRAKVLRKRNYYYLG